jgi:hypothetical protein
MGEGRIRNRARAQCERERELTRESASGQGSMKRVEWRPASPLRARTDLAQFVVLGILNLLAGWTPRTGRAIGPWAGGSELFVMVDWRGADCRGCRGAEVQRYRGAEVQRVPSVQWWGWWLAWSENKLKIGRALSRSKNANVPLSSSETSPPAHREVLAHTQFPSLTCTALIKVFWKFHALSLLPLRLPCRGYPGSASMGMGRRSCTAQGGKTLERSEGSSAALKIEPRPARTT